MNEKYRSVFEMPNFRLDANGTVADRLPRPDIFQIIEGYKNNKGEILQKVSRNLVARPEYCDLFFYCLNDYSQRHKENSTVVQSFRDCLTNKYLGEAAMAQDTFSLTEEQLLGFTKMTLGDNPLSIDEADVELNEQFRKDRIRASKVVMKGFIAGTLNRELKENIRSVNMFSLGPLESIFDNLIDSQKKIVFLLHTLTMGVLRAEDEQLYKYLYEILALKTDLFQNTDPQSCFLFLGNMSLADEVIRGYDHIKHLLYLWSRVYDSVSGNTINSLWDLIYKENNNIADYYKNFLKLSSDNRIQILFDRLEKTKKKDRPETLDDLVSQICQPLSFPEDVIYQADIFWVYYNRLFSEYRISQTMLPSTLVTFSDEKMRMVVLEGDEKDVEEVRNIIGRKIEKNDIPAFITKLVMEKNLSEGEGMITNKYVINSALTYLKPEFNQENVSKQVDIERAKLKIPKRGIDEEGVIFETDRKTYPDVAASEIFFDQSGSKIILTIGNYQIPLYLNDQYQLCYADKKPVEVDEETRIWWETIILSTLSAYACYEREEDVLVVGSEDLFIEEAVRRTRKEMVRRIPHLRREPPSQGYTEEQKIRTLSVRYPLLKMETLDLKTYNEQLGLTRKDGQYTYVFPVKKEKRDRPLRLRTPNALDYITK